VCDYANHRIQRFEPKKPAVTLFQGSTELPTPTGSFSFDTIRAGHPLSYTFTLDNGSGTAALTVSNLQVPAGFELTGAFPVTVAAGNQATFSIALAATMVGAYTGILSFATNVAGKNPYTITLTGTVRKATQTITFAPFPVKTYRDAPLLITATTSSGLPLTFTSSDPSVAKLEGNKLTIVGVGQTTIMARQAGNEQYESAFLSQTLTVRKIPQTIRFEAIADQTIGNPSLLLTAVASSGLPVSFHLIAGPVTIQGNSLTITDAGLVTLKAVQEGNDTIAPVEIESSFCVSPAKPVVTSANLFLTSSSPTGNQWYRNDTLVPEATQPRYEVKQAGTYLVRVSGPCGAAIASDPIIIDVLGIEDIPATKLTLFPNPATRAVTLQLPQGLTCSAIRMYTLTGKAVFYQTYPAQTVVHLSIASVPRGYYTLAITTNKSVLFTPLLVQ
jgi:hypothetical protein